MTATPTPPGLKHVFTIVAEVAPELAIERRGDDTVDIIPITGGTVSGAVSGVVEPGGADWCRSLAEGIFEVEARYWVRTDSGSIIDIVNVGRAAVNPDPSQGEYFMTTPQFRTTDPELQWLTQRVFLGRAESSEAATTIHVFEVTG